MDIYEDGFSNFEDIENYWQSYDNFDEPDLPRWIIRKYNVKYLP